MLKPEEESGLSFHRAVLPVAGVAVLSALFAFLPFAFGRTIVDTPRFNDIGHQWIPFANFLRDCYKAGVFPLWDPHDLCGMPFLAFSHTSSLYPGWVLLNLASASYPTVMALDIFIHLGLAGASTVLLFLYLGRTRPSAFAAGVVFAFSGFLFNSINVPHTLHTCAWLPAWYLGCFALLRRPRFSVYIAASVCLALMIVGGALETAMYAFIGLAFEVILRWREKTLTRAAMVALATSLVTAALIAAALLLPATELLQNSIRAQGFLKPGNSPLLLLPMIPMIFLHVPTDIFPSNHGMNVFYLEALLILFAAFGMKFSYSRKRIMFIPVALLYLVIFHSYPLNQLTSWIPVLGKTMVPLRMWTVVMLFFLLASTYAADRWAENVAKQQETAGGCPLPFSRTGAVIILVYAAAVLVSLYWLRQALPFRVLFALSLGMLGVAALLPRKIPGRLLKRPAALLAIIIVLDVYGLALGHMPMSRPEELKVDHRVSSAIRNTAGRARYLIIGTAGPHDTGLPFHLGMRVNADTIDTTVRIPLMNAAKRLDMLYPQLIQYKHGLIKYDPWLLRGPGNIDQEKAFLLNRMNVRFVISRRELPSMGINLKPIRQDKHLHIYQNPHARQRAVIKTTHETIPLMALYPAPDKVNILLPPKIPAPAKDKQILISDTYTPGWRAFQENKEITVSTGKLAFRKLKLKTRAPPQITMKYIPYSFRIGLWASLTSLLAMAAAVAAGRFIKSALRKMNINRTINT